MSVKLYPSGSSGQVYARAQLTLGVKRGSRVAMRKTRFAAYSNNGYADLLSTIFGMMDKIDGMSTGEIMGIQLTLGHFVKDDVIPSEPIRSTNAFAVVKNSRVPKHVSFVTVPWLKNDASINGLEAILQNPPFIDSGKGLCNIQLASDGKTIEMTPSNDFKHLTIKDTWPDNDDVVSTGDVKGDAGADGMVDGDETIPLIPV